MTRHEIAIENLSGQSETARRLACLVLVRLAIGPCTEAEITKDVLPLVAMRSSPEIWRIELSRLLAALQAGQLVAREDGRIETTADGTDAVSHFLGSPRALPSSWTAARDKFLMAIALGFEKASASRLKQLGKADGLRTQIVIKHWKLRLKGAPSASRVRSALAVKALERAFGNKIRDGLGQKSSLPAKSSRLLAGQLASEARDFGTDSRLIAALAAEAVGARKADLKSLQLAVLRAYFAGDEAPAPQPKRRSGSSLKRGRRNRVQGGAPAPMPDAEVMAAPAVEAVSVAEAVVEVSPALSRPGPEGFAREVNAAALAVADGWAGNRRAFISKVWSVLQEKCAAWRLTEIEFKCMLTEAHRTGLVMLANADLKDKRFLREFQDSAVVYKNTVWHYVRVPE
ncbi:MAG: hypothetical protein R3D67_13060 [Hyphomicrobiaceae bacterium]